MKESSTDDSQHLEPTPLWFSCRLILGLVSFVGFTNVFMLRVNINVALLCMVNHSALHDMNLEENWKFDINNETTASQQINTNESTCGSKRGDSVENISNGEFIWPKDLQGIVLGSFYWGYTTTQILGGWVATRIGAKRVFGYSMLLNAVCALLTPIGARTSVYLLIILQVIGGMCQGSAFPSIQVLLTRWSPPLELGKLCTIAYSGLNFGIVLTFPLGAVLCEHGFGGGWPSIYYLFGGSCILWFIAWMYLVADTPDEHPRISARECAFINRSIGLKQHARDEEKPLKVPWMKIMTSKPVWAIYVVHFCANFGGHILIINIPTYMKEVLKFDIKKNGGLSSLPYMFHWLVSLLAGYAFDCVRSHGVSRRSARRAGNLIGCTVPAVFLIILSFLDCTNRTGAVACLVMAVGLTGFFVGAGYCSNSIDIAPRYAGMIMGISNTFASIPGFIGPAIIGILTKNGTKEEWQIVFFGVAAMYLLGCTFTFIFVSGDIQPWDGTKLVDISVNCEERVTLREDSTLDKSTDIT